MFNCIQKYINIFLDQLLVKNTSYKELKTNIEKINNNLDNIITIVKKFDNEQQNIKINEILQKQTANDILCSKIYYTCESYNNTIFSYCINEFQKNNDGLYKSFIYNYYKTLHDLTKIKTINKAYVEKVRVGKANDGGYVMLKPFSKNKIAYSIGINDDVSWDKDMVEYGYEIYQYDHTISELPENNQHFHWLKLGLTGLKETGNLKYLRTLIANNNHDMVCGMVLKMDIEGYEWDVLNECDENTLKQFDQIVIELHNLNNLNYSKKIIDGLKKLTKNHYVVNLHGNAYRYVSFCGDLMTPDVLELTLINNSFYKHHASNIEFMTQYDESNKLDGQDIWISKW